MRTKNHIHQWVKNGHSRGKQRYYCKICKTTRYETESDINMKIYNSVLSLANNDNAADVFVWSDYTEMEASQEEIEQGENIQNFKVTTINLCYNEFFRLLKKRGKANLPIIAFVVEPDPEGQNWRDKQLLIYKIS